MNTRRRKLNRLSSVTADRAPHLIRWARLMIIALAAVGMATLVSHTRIETAHAGDTLAEAASTITDSPTVEQAEPADPAAHHVIGGMDDLAEQAAGIDRDFSTDYLTAEFPAAYAANLDFRHIFSHGLTDEVVFAVALPRCIPTAIP